MIDFSDFLGQITKEPLFVVDVNAGYDNFTPIDLSENNTALTRFNTFNAFEFEQYINQFVLTNSAKVAYGGYNEVRTLYKRSDHFYTDHPEEERNIHLGMDFWCNAGTPVIAVLDGKIHSFKDNDSVGNYGPTIILEHGFDGIVFYSLYGHLSKASLSGLTIGARVYKGQKIGTLGDAAVNGDYAPHLHFQIIKDLEGMKGDYKGVTSRKDQVKDLANCPDPNILLKIY